MSHTVIPLDCAVTVRGNRNPARPRGVGETNPANTEDILKMPKLKTLAALAAAVEAARRYARKNPDQAGKYVDQAAAFVDKQTKGKYSGQIHGVVGKVKSVGGLPPTTTQAYDTNVGYGKHQGYGASPADAGPADDDRAVDHPAARLAPRPRGRRSTRIAPSSGPSRAARTSDRAADAAPPPPTRTAVVPR